MSGSLNDACVLDVGALDKMGKTAKGGLAGGGKQRGMPIALQVRVPAAAGEAP